MTTAQAATPNQPAIGKKLSLIDTDVHHQWRHFDEVARHLPRFWRETGLSMPAGSGWSNPHGVNRRDAAPDDGGPAGSSVAKLCEHHIDKFGIDYAVLQPGNALGLCVHPNTDYAAALATAVNTWQAEAWWDADPRFLGSIVIAPQHPATAVEEIKRWANHPKVCEIYMSSATRIPLGDKHYWPIYEAACEAGLPLAVHPGKEGSGISGISMAGHPSTYLEWHTNLSQNYMGQVASLVLQGVFEQFPTFKFIAVEGGFGWLPHLMWRMDKNWKALRFTVPWLKRAPSEYIIEHVRLTTQPIEEPESDDHLRAIFEMIHAEKTLMFSSDYPHWDNDSPAKALPRLDDALRERILWQNAAELFGLTA